MQAGSKRYLVTGATGFLGSHVVRQLIADGHQVRALVRGDSPRAHLLPAGVERWRGDLEAPKSLRGIAEGVDAVIHTACAVAGTFDSAPDVAERFLAVNRDGSVRLAREVLAAGNPRMVHVSSTAAMGPPATQVVDERSACTPQTPYQRSKREAELALAQLHEEEGLNVVTLRPCVIAGEGKEASELLTLFRLVRRGLFPYIGAPARKAPGPQKPMVMVDDVVTAIRLATTASVAGETFLITSGERHTMTEILDTAAQIVGRRRGYVRVPVIAASWAAEAMQRAQTRLPRWNPPLTPERLRLFTADRVIDIGAARERLGYAPEHTTLDEMLGRTHAYYVASGLLRV